MITVVAIFAVLVWLTAVCWAFMRSLDATYDAPWSLRAAATVLGTMLLFAVPVGVIVDSQAQDGYSDRLCLTGHQELKTSRRSPAIVGRVIVPGGTSTSKVWVCDRWEAQ